LVTKKGLATQAHLFRDEFVSQALLDYKSDWTHLNFQLTSLLYQTLFGMQGNTRLFLNLVSIAMA